LSSAADVLYCSTDTVVWTNKGIECRLEFILQKIFGFQKWKSVKQIICGLGRLDFVHLRYFYIFKFCKIGMYCVNKTLSFLMKLFYLSNSFKFVWSISGFSDMDYWNLNTVRPTIRKLVTLFIIFLTVVLFKCLLYWII